MSVILESSPILSHRMSSGTQASDGTARIAPRVEPKNRSQVRARPVTAPSTSPSDAPIAKPTSTRCVEMQEKLDRAVPRSTSSMAASRTLAGDGSWTGVNQPERGDHLPQATRIRRWRRLSADDATRLQRRGGRRGDGTGGPRLDRGHRAGCRGAGRWRDRPGAGHAKRLGSAFVTNVALTSVAESRVDLGLGPDVAGRRRRSGRSLDSTAICAAPGTGSTSRLVRSLMTLVGHGDVEAGHLGEDRRGLVRVRLGPGPSLLVGVDDGLGDIGLVLEERLGRVRGSRSC